MSAAGSRGVTDPRAEARRIVLAVLREQAAGSGPKADAARAELERRRREAQENFRASIQSLADAYVVAYEKIRGTVTQVVNTYAGYFKELP